MGLFDFMAPGGSGFGIGEGRGVLGQMYPGLDAGQRQSLALMGIGDLLRGGSGSSAIGLADMMAQGHKAEAEKAKAERDRQASLDMMAGLFGGGQRTPQVRTPATPVNPNTPEAIAADAMSAIGKVPSYDWSKFAVGGAAARPDSFTGLDPSFAARVHKMTTEAHAAGIPLQITSAYRSPELQAELYKNAIAKYGSPEAARKWVAPPGRSKHNAGVAVDFAVDGSLIRDPNSPAARWVRENAAKYGLDVPMSWEPWQVEMAGARGQAAPEASAPSQQPQPAMDPQRASAILMDPNIPDAVKQRVLGMVMPQPRTEAQELDLEAKRLDVLAARRELDAPVARETAKDAAGRLRYLDDGSYVFPDVSSELKYDWDASNKERSDWEGLAANKEFGKQASAFGRVVASAQDASPAGDLALIFNYMKVLDPGSTVREGEFATAQNAGGVDSRIMSLYNQVVEGTRLTEGQRADFLDRAERLYNEEKREYDKRLSNRKRTLDARGLNPEFVLTDFTFTGEVPQMTMGPPPPPVGAPPPTMTVEEALSIADELTNAGGQ